MTPTLDVIGFGALNLDEILKVPSILQDGETVVQEYQAAPGGSAANTVYALAKLGLKTGFMGAVGADEAGRTLVRDLEQNGVDTTGIRSKSGYKSGRVIAIADSFGRRALYVVEPGANSALSPEDLDPAYARQAKFLHLSSFVGEAQLDCQRWLVEQLPASTKISFAPGAIYARRGPEELVPVLQRSHVLFGNQREIEELSGANYREGAKYLLGVGCKIVAITTPSASYVVNVDGAYNIESDPAEDAVDATGAGDAYAAGFLYGLLRGKQLEQCGRLGHLVARFSVTRLGARAGLPTRTQLLEAYRAKYSSL